MGTAARMGPGFFPTLLGGLLAVLGLMLSVPALLRDGEPFPKLHLRPMLMILASIVVFALLLQPLGFRARRTGPDRDRRVLRSGPCALSNRSRLHSS